MKKAIGYIRVSTQEQAREGVSLDAQRTKIEAMCIAKDLELVEIIEDAGKSGKDLKRPGIQRIIEAIESKSVDAVIIYKLDRLTRSVRDLGFLIDLFTKKEIDLVSVQDSIDTSTAAGRLVLNIMGSVSQWEREVIGERTSEALQHKKAMGKVYGTTPYGYRREGDDLVPDETEQENIRLVKSLQKKGFSLRAIGRELKARRIKTKMGGTKWRPQQVKNLLKAA